MASKGSPGKGKQDGSGGAVKAAVITGVATVMAALVALLASNQAGVVTFAGGSNPGKIITITPAPGGGTVTVTASPVPDAPGPITMPGCPARHDCYAYNLQVKLGSARDSFTGLDFSDGSSMPNYPGDMSYEWNSKGNPELAVQNASSYDVISSGLASKAGCSGATNSAPDADPITDFHKGLLFCVSTSLGIALLMETQPLPSDKTLYLREEFWVST